VTDGKKGIKGQGGGGARRDRGRDMGRGEWKI